MSVLNKPCFIETTFVNFFNANELLNMKYFLLSLIIHFFSLSLMADVRLPKIFGDNMVLQRNKPIPVWGWAAPGEKITILFNNQVRKTIAGKYGKWKIELNEAPAGGPYQLLVTGKNKVVLNNILVGEVWICAGQSNMEMNVSSSQNAEEEIRNADYPQIRHIKVPNITSGIPLDDLTSGEWKIGSPATVGSFTAVGYFFARKIHKELKVPVGIINSSWGGSMIETWISRDTLEKNDDFKNVFRQISLNEIEALNEKQFQSIRQEIEAAQGSLTPASPEDWKNISFDHSNWKKMVLPVNFDQSGFAIFDGTIWFRKEIVLDRTAASKPAIINLSTIDDLDETYINGRLVGNSKAYNIIRQYSVPAGILKEGINVVAIRVTDNNSNGGFFGKPSDLNLACINQIIPLAGDWYYKIEALKKNPVNPNSYPSLLFNSMINPLVPFAIKGVLWYQGETNAERAYQYRTAFPLLIKNWRNSFRQGDFPFYFVQLASYRAGDGNSTNGSSWAELREAQTETLSMANTGMAVTLDIGETNDIHPKNKQDVGARLAAIALSQLYNNNVAYIGPVYQSMKIEGSKAIVSFSYIDSGFLVKDKYNYIKGFEIAGTDKKFYFARAFIENGKVVVHSDSVLLPVAVRYGWADDMPEANLYNKQGFPTLPFRTDKWQGITENSKYSAVN